VRTFSANPLSWLIGTAILAFCLGYAGYRDFDAAGLGRLDAAYQALQLFVIGGESAPHMPWSIQVARFLAPLSVATAAVVAAMAFLRDRFDRFLIRLFARDHVVVVGLSSTSESIAGAMLDAGERVVVVESDPANPLLTGIRARGARVIVGDGRRPAILNLARIARARHVVVTTGDDTTNLDVADQVRLVRAGGRHRHTTTHVAIDDPTLWLEVGRLTFGRSTGGTTVECFNLIDRTAHRLVDVAASISPLRNVALIGDDRYVERAVAHLQVRATLSGQPVGVADGPGSNVDAVLVCPGDNALAEAIRIARTQPDSDVFVAVTSNTTDTLLELLEGLDDRLHVVASTRAALAGDFLQNSAMEAMARAKHDDYVHQERAKGLTRADNASIVGWAELPESLRDSNRRFAASVAETLDSIGAILVPLRNGARPDLPLDAQTLEQLAVGEHDRWATDLTTDGWRYAPGSKDPEAKTHPLLVPWEQLSEEEREKDRDAMRAIPQMLMRAGFGIVVPDRR